ncbi:MAG: zf-HC2 domain-containing protein [Candidatus Limnocylindria bacterium]
MTMNRDRHEPFDELVSASLAGDLSADEQRRLDAHLATCETCRTTLTAFGDQRRIMAGLRHVAPPRDLGARVRTGIERGSFANLPWWRRPAAIFAGVGGGLAVVAGALFALVLLNGSPEEPQVGGPSTTPTPTTSISASATPGATLPPPATTAPSEPAATAAPSASASASAEPAPTASPSQASPEPDIFLALTGPFDNLALTVRHGLTTETIAEIDTPTGPPIAAELSPDGQWLAYITRGNGSGINEVRATRIAEGIPSDDLEDLPPTDSPIAVGETVILGRSVAGSPFLEHLSWSSNSYYLAYTLADPDGDGTDAWMFDVSFGEPRPLTDVGNAYAASWIPGGAGTSLVWISTADAEPVSYLHGFHDSAGDPDDPRLGEAGDPAEDSLATAEGVFQPILSPNGSLAIYWKGRMDRVGDEWLLGEGGAPYLAEHDDEFAFANERQLFSDLTIGREAFTSAGITWGADGDAYAVWNTQWTGVSQGGESDYPDPRRVYFGHATDPRGLTQTHAIDASDIPDGSSVVDVKVSPTGRHLLVTAQRPIGGIMEAPAADLLFIERNTGDTPDEVFFLGDADRGWFGPAAFDALPDPEDP